MVFASDLSIAVYADGADFETIAAWTKDPFIKAFTTNPTPIRKTAFRTMNVSPRML